MITLISLNLIVVSMGLLLLSKLELLTFLSALLLISCLTIIITALPVMIQYKIVTRHSMTTFEKGTYENDDTKELFKLKLNFINPVKIFKKVPRRPESLDSYF